MKKENSLFGRISKLFTKSKTKSELKSGTRLESRPSLNIESELELQSELQSERREQNWLLEESSALTVRYLPVVKCESKITKMASLSQKLDSIVLKRKLYLDPHLSLTTLSMHLGVNRTYMSNILREKRGFKIYINTLRLDYFSQQIEAIDPSLRISKKEVARLAMQSGFADMRTFKRTVFELKTQSSKQIIQRIYSPLQVPEEEQILRPYHKVE